jgi:hypothetical protein
LISLHLAEYPAHQLVGTHRPQVQIAYGGAQSRYLGVIESGGQDVRVGVLDGPGIRTLALMSRPHLPSVVSGGEEHAEPGGLAIHPVEMFKEIPAPEVFFLIVVVEHVETRRLECLSHLLHVRPLLIGKRQAHVVLEVPPAATRHPVYGTAALPGP